jgi:hypothetical protein
MYWYTEAYLYRVSQLRLPSFIELQKVSMKTYFEIYEMD